MVPPAVGCGFSFGLKSTEFRIGTGSSLYWTWAVARAQLRTLWLNGYLTLASSASRYKRPNLEFIHDEDSHQLQRRYDLVTAFEVLEHIDKWNDFLDRIANSARRFILLSFPTGNMRPFEKAMGHYRNFKPEEVEQLMLERDFRPISLLYAGFPFYSPLYRDFCNLTQPQISSFVTGTYGLTKRMVSILVYCSFRFCSTRRRFGDQFCGLFSRISENLEPSES
jgi:hypothetical protein